MDRLLHVFIAVFVPTLEIRFRLPAEALASQAGWSVRYGEPPFRLPDLAPEAPKLLIAQRPPLGHLQAWREAVAGCMKEGWLVVVEYDDHPTLIAQWIGREPSALDWEKFSCCHAVQTSTERLRQALLPHNPEVKVFRNAVFDLPPFPQDHRPNRVFLSATGPRPSAIGMAASLGGLPEAEFVVVANKCAFEALPTANKTFHAWLPHSQYLDLMGSCVVSLAPMEDRPFWDCKSDVKFLDAASRGVLTIASPTVYGETITDGRNGLIAHKLPDWRRLLVLALSDPAGRKEKAQRAWQYVRDERMFADQIPERRQWYMDLWTRREELTARLIARCPALAQELGT
jgi:hypothetical protein